MAPPTATPPYACASLKKVLPQPPGAPRRPYLPRGSRTHISLTATASTAAGVEGAKGLGVARLLRVYDGSDRDKVGRGEHIACSDGVCQSPSEGRGSLPVALTGLIAADGDVGTCLTRRTVHEDDGGTWQSPPLPSGRRICCVELSSESRSAMVQQCSGGSLFPSTLLYVADVLGNVYTATLPPSSGKEDLTAEPPAKRPRVDVQANHERDSSSFWGCIASASAGGIRTYGASGWCGLVPLAGSQLLCCREFFFDLRLLDASVTGTVVRRYGTLHAATGITACAGIFPHSVVVAEGPVASVYDSRCSGVVMTQTPETVGRGERTFPLVMSRFTNPTARVVDVCATCNEFDVAMAVGRAVCVHDVRKWTRTSITTSVLKYDIGSIAPFACGKGVVAVGIDAEVRPILLEDKACAAPTAVGTCYRDNGGCSGDKGVDVGTEVNSKWGAAPGNEGPAASTSFRNRIDSLVSCRSTWQGGWVPSVGGCCATGISADHEFFIAF